MLITMATVGALTRVGEPHDWRYRSSRDRSRY